MPLEKGIVTDTENKNLRVILKKSVYAGVVGGLADYFILGDRGSGSLAGMALPASVVAGTGVAMGSAASDLVSDYVIEKMTDQSPGTKSLEETAVKLSLSGVGTVVALNVIAGVPPDATSFIVGGLSKFGGDAVYTNSDPMLLGALW